MKKFFHFIIIVFTSVFLSMQLSSCIDEDEYSDSPQGNFEALWKILDQRYCFFDYKGQEYGLDWNENTLPA